MNDRIRLVIATNILDIGGAERTVQTLALYVDSKKFDVTILCLVRGGPRVKLLEERGAKVLVGNGTIEKIKELIPHPEIDILHFHRSGQRESELHEQVVNYLQPKKLMETNIFAFTDPVLGPQFDLQVYKSIMMLAERAWKGRSHEGEACLRQRVVYNPVTVDYFDQFRLSDDQREQKRRELGVVPDEVLLGRVGRNDTVKWGDLILSALPEIFKNNPKVKILFRTVPTARLAWLKSKNFFNGRVIVLPESSSEQEIAETYQLLDVCVHTSRRGEAFGNSLNEAMVWGLPIIVENTPHWDNGQLEQVDNGVTGWVVKSVGGLVGAVTDLVGQPQRRMNFGSAGREKVTSAFGWQRGVHQYELAYQQLFGSISESIVLQEMYPQPDSIVSYHQHYKELGRMDFPHNFSVLLELKRHVDYWRWRVVDSLQARGFIKL
jgi:glycosyltransferase involved in cell wall biosynthesis